MPGIDANTVLCLHCDGTNGSTSFTDASSAAHTIIQNGTAQVGTSQSKFGGGSVVFTTGGDYLASADSADWDFGSGDFTIDMWVWFDSIAGPATLATQSSTAISDQAFRFSWQQFNSNLYFQWSTDGTNYNTVNRAWSPSTGTWYHVAVVRTGTTLKLFVDGTQLGSDGSITGALYNSGQVLCFANWGTSVVSERLIGRLDEIRVSKGIARWTSNFTPPSAAYDTTAAGNTYTKAGYATAGGVGAGPSASITQETGRATAGGIGAGGSASVFVESGFATVGGVGSGSRQRVRLRSGYATIGGVGAGPSASVFVEAGNATAGTVGSGASQKTAASGGTVYPKAGLATLGGVGSGPSESIFQETGGASVGTVGSGSSQKIVGGASYTKTGFATLGGVGSGVAVASSAFGIDAFTVLCVHADGADASTAFVDSSRYVHTVTAVGNAQVDTAQSKFGGSSLLLDGTNSYLAVADSADWTFGSGDFTIDLWARWNAHTTDQALVAQIGTSFGFSFDRDNWNDTLTFGWSTTGSDAPFANTGWIPTDNVWYHIAFVRTGNTGKFFVDGTQVGSNQSVTGTFFDSNGELHVGARAAAGFTLYFNGWLDEIRISKGIARWTSNFTPPSVPYSAAPAVYQKAGQATTAGVGAGMSASIFAESGYATITGIGAGISARKGLVFAESGYATITGKGSGIRRMPGHDLILIPEETDHMVLVPSLTGHF